MRHTDSAKLERLFGKAAFLTGGADILMTAASVAAVRLLLSGPWCIMVVALLVVRALLVSRSPSGQFCRSVAIATVLTYIFREVASINVLFSKYWIGAWILLVVVAVEGVRSKTAAGIAGLVVGTAALLMLPPSDTSILDYRIGIVGFELIFVITSVVVISAVSRRWPRVAYVSGPVLVFLPVVALWPFVVAAGTNAKIFIGFWAAAFVVPGLIAAALTAAQDVIAKQS